MYMNILYTVQLQFLSKERKKKRQAVEGLVHHVKSELQLIS